MDKVQIKVPHGSVVSMSRSLGCSRNTIYDALCGKTRTEKAQRIRDLAVSEYGGYRCQKVRKDLV